MKMELFNQDIGYVIAEKLQLPIGDASPKWARVKLEYNLFPISQLILKKVLNIYQIHLALPIKYPKFR